MLHTCTRMDIMGLISVEGANPNGDPLCSGRPRIDTDGYGIISDVCLKRKIRNRLALMGEDIFVTPPRDEMDTLSGRALLLKGFHTGNFFREACSKWFDVRAFGQAFPFAVKPSDYGTLGVRGPVTIQRARSLHPIEIEESAITRCINAASIGRRGPDTLGFTGYVKYGLYVMKASICPYTASKTGFTYQDSELLKQAILEMFTGDASAARPAGSMRLERLYWWNHRTHNSRYPAHVVFDTVKFSLKEGVSAPRCFEDYEISEQPLSELFLDVY